MSHNISEASGRPEMFYTGERPWHGLGTELAQPATAAEAIEAARMGWEVKKVPVHLPDGVEIPGHYATVREDTGAALGVVGDQYQPIQNKEAFSFFDSVVGGGQAIYHTAGSLGQGERVWILAKLPEIIRVTVEDVVEEFLLLTNSHNGWSSLRMFYTPVRVVCQNTLNMALGGAARKGIAIRHSGDIRSKIGEAQRALGLAVEFYSEFAEVAELCRKQELAMKQLDAYLKAVVPDPKDGRISARAKNVRDEMTRLFETGKGNALPGVRGTLWAALNAVAEYADHVRIPRAKDPADRASNRLEGIWFGSGATLKARAWDQALALVKK